MFCKGKTQLSIVVVRGNTHARRRRERKQSSARVLPRQAREGGFPTALVLVLVLVLLLLLLVAVVAVVVLFLFLLLLLRLGALVLFTCQPQFLFKTDRTVLTAASAHTGQMPLSSRTMVVVPGRHRPVSSAWAQGRGVLKLWPQPKVASWRKHILVVEAVEVVVVVVVVVVGVVYCWL